MTEEAEFQADVIRLANMFGWRHMHVRRTIGKGNKWTTGTSVKGWPDLVLYRPDASCPGIIYAELKSSTGELSTEQQVVLADLDSAGAEVYVWDPSDLEAIAKRLSRRKP